ncbi:H(+)-transporting V1 sector ATPase subunit F [Sorochytrium milnesiophthora]
MTTQQQYKDRSLIAVIGDEVRVTVKCAAVKEAIVDTLGWQDTVTGLLLAGVGHIDAKQKKNFLVVDNKTTMGTIEETFRDFISRRDIAIILINQHIAEDIRGQLDDHQAAFPTVLEIPSKDHPYDPSKGTHLSRVQKLFGNE